DLPVCVLEINLDTASRSTGSLDLGLAPNDPAQNLDRFRLLAQALLPSFSRPFRGERFLDAGLRPGGQTLPDLVFVSALQRLQNLLECRFRHRLPLGPDDGGKIGDSRTPRDEQRQEHHPDKSGRRVLEHGHLTGWKRTPAFPRAVTIPPTSRYPGPVEQQLTQSWFSYSRPCGSPGSRGCRWGRWPHRRPRREGRATVRPEENARTRRRKRTASRPGAGCK